MATGSDGFALHDRLSRMLDIVFRSVLMRGRRAESFADTLRSICPLSELWLCYLNADTSSELAVLDHDSARADTAELFPLMPEEFQSLAASGNGSVVLPEGLGLQDSRLIVERLAAGGDCFGLVGMAVPASVAGDGSSTERRALTMFARELALRLALDGFEQRRQTLVELLSNQAHLTSFDELSRSVGHEFNNLLNVLTLQMAVVEQELPEHLQNEVAEIRIHIRRMAAAVKELQHYRHQPLLRAMDLRSILHPAIQTANLGFPFDIPAGLPPVLGFEPDLHELCSALLKLSAELAGVQPDEFILYAQAAPRRVAIRLERLSTVDESRPRSLADLQQINAAVQADLDCCADLAHKLSGRVRCRRDKEGILSVEIELPAANASASSGGTEDGS